LNFFSEDTNSSAEIHSWKHHRNRKSYLVLRAASNIVARKAEERRLFEFVTGNSQEIVDLLADVEGLR